MAIAPTSPHDPHRWTLLPGLVPLDDETRALLQHLRRRPRPGERRYRRLAWLLVALLHALFVASLWLAMRPAPRPPVVVEASLDTSVLQVRFIPRTRPTGMPPPPPVLKPPARPPPVHQAPRKDAMQVQAAPVPASSVTPHPVVLFDRDGVARLPAAAATTAPAPVPEYVQRKPSGDMQVMRHTTPLPYRPTRFEQYFPPPGENAAQAGLRHVVEALHGKGPSTKTVNLPRGVHLKCKTLLGVPTPFCGLPPAPPPPNDGDERLNMAATPLAGDPHAPPPPALATCIAAYRSQGPLPYGCPVDTPARAVDEEIRECITRFRAGKRLPTWCPADTARRASAAPAGARP